MPKFKSFDELLEEKLQLENEQPKTPGLEFEFAANPKSRSDSTKPFLKRGSGLARYGGVGAPKNLATPKLRRSTSNVSRKQNNDNAGDKQTRLIKTSTSAPNAGNIPTKKPMTRKTSLKLKPKSNQNDEVYDIGGNQSVKGAHARTELALDDSQDSNETSDDLEDNGIAHHMFSRILNLRN